MQAFSGELAKWGPNDRDGPGAMRESGRFVQAAHQKTKPTVGGFLPEAPCRGSATV